MAKQLHCDSERAAYYALDYFNQSIEALPEEHEIDMFQLAQVASLAGFCLDGRYQKDSEVPNVDEVNSLANTIIALSEQR